MRKATFEETKDVRGGDLRGETARTVVKGVVRRWKANRRDGATRGLEQIGEGRGVLGADEPVPLGRDLMQCFTRTW